MANSSLLFARKFLGDITRVAAVVPSSRYIAHETCRYVDTTQPQTILELGAGTGAITKVALEKMHPESRLLSVEIDPDFIPILKKTCPGAEVIQADASAIEAVLKERQIGHIDVVLGGLPTPVMPQSANRALFECLHELAYDSFFSQITNFPWYFYRMHKRLFQSVEFRMVWANIPPGGVYHCQRLRKEYLQHIPGK